MTKRALLLFFLLTVLIFACQKEETHYRSSVEDASLDLRSGDTDIDASLLDNINAALVTSNADYRVAMVEYMTAPDPSGGNEQGRTVFFRDLGNKQLAFDFVPFDSRRSPWSGPIEGSNDNITYLVDRVDDVPPFGGLRGMETTNAIDRAMGTWDEQTCSDLDITKNFDFGLDWGVIAYIFGLGGGPFVNADIMHAGFTDIDFSGGVIGATFTFGFIDGNGNFTDINNDGKLDAAFREIYYDPSFPWAIDGNFDVETIALHEAGHGLSQGHFGTLSLTTSNGKFHFSPRAVMNAAYTGVQQNLKGTDDAGHCSIWGSWPQN